MNIAVTDDHEIIREGLKKILAKHNDLIVVAETASIGELEKALKTKEIELVMLDISLPDKSGLDFVKDLKSQYPEVKVLLFSIYPDEKFGKRALSMGADGYLSKSAKPSEIIEAIRKIESGGKYLKSELIEELILRPDRSLNQKTHEILSNREFEVLRLLAQGKKIKDVAESMGLSVNTIASYKTRIQEKLNIKSTADLIRFAIDNDLIEKF